MCAAIYESGLYVLQYHKSTSQHLLSVGLAKRTAQEITEVCMMVFCEIFKPD